ncbi:hypothetical protein BJV82DRAFT_670475 [Fennellomyces sp. T-0311]|nr:hypothetical protein BJV82DRAFT_670475 [Fennellomyces sp. T-0311]
MSPERRWDPILFLPASSQARHRLVKWRMHWLPSFPLKKCRCGVSGKTPNRYHFQPLTVPLLVCPLVEPAFQRLLQSYNKPVDRTQHIIDILLNDLPRKAKSLRSGHWRRTWPLLLQVLRDIDVCTHPDTQFDPEPDPQLILDAFFADTNSNIDTTG